MMPEPYQTHGITTKTVQNMLLDSGAVYINYGETTGERIIGATSGGNSFVVEREIKEIEVDGAKMGYG